MIRRIKSERERTLVELRNRHNDFDGYAREILSDTLNCRSSSIARKLQPSDVKIDVYESWNRDVPVYDSHNDQNESGGQQIHQQFDDEAELMSFLGSEDHHNLMAEISEALQAEYQELVDKFDIDDYENGDFSDDCERLQEEAELNDSEILICPICR